ncbi:hypothetical protein SAMN06265795_10833 [Noviherbaspirillum humi]|uniref:Uncharacterized protein n=1 Tax=Noviherbaspirillum humi TaxID=1688639 RepID=A0A239I337_9BURK|nr:zinc ribbon domain-containing protein [Noviherbaspirillum humi]SNS86754.1 hypothetical protein SAMN06265795_10833 [Noviherbaspirillum humi]
MSTENASTQPSGALMSVFDSLLGVTDAYRNVRAIGLLGITFIAAIALFGLFSAMGASAGSFGLGAIGGLLAMVVTFYGLNAVGILLMRQVEQQPAVSMKDAVLLSLFSSHRLAGVMLLEGLILLGIVLVIAVVLFVCKIPFLGPILFTVVLPVTAIIMGVCLFALFFIMFPLAGPAVWSGSSLMQVVARLNGIARHKLVPVIIQQFILGMIVMFVAAVLMGIVSSGMMSVSGMSAGILNIGGMNFVAGLVGGMSGMGGGSGYLIAGGIGGGFLLALAAVVPVLMYTKGLCVIYVGAANGIDFSKAEAQLEGGLQTVRRKAEEARERARQLAPQAPLATAAAGPAAAGLPACPSCHGMVTPDDVFCGHCGHKLK